ncbi:MAG: type III pantothenate kinase, partial [Eubacteriales bacterium]|nr:type III pantothenate kinase [Eubacteriales bacterium]
LEIYDADPSSFEGAIISSVIPETDALSDAVEKITEKKPIIVSPGIKTGLNIRIDNPAQLGSDLVVAAVAALAEYRTPIIIVDMGTATTFSVIDRKRNFLGGTIHAGVMISLNALTSNTAQLQQVELIKPANVIGTNTVDSLKSGLLYGNAALVDGMIERIEAELGEKTTVIATGGHAEYIVPYCNHSIKYDEGLLLKGLLLIYNKNK